MSIKVYFKSAQCNERARVYLFLQINSRPYYFFVRSYTQLEKSVKYLKVVYATQLDIVLSMIFIFISFLNKFFV
ncbi:hypothetical protein CWE34_10980 [Bacillus sp. SN10]|nr:hypothetical protein CWE34_10980 [Bacillus sp. SN10]